jgi:hypothetical protein
MCHLLLLDNGPSVVESLELTDIVVVVRCSSTISTRLAPTALNAQRRGLPCSRFALLAVYALRTGPCVNVVAVQRLLMVDVMWRGVACCCRMKPGGSGHTSSSTLATSTLSPTCSCRYGASWHICPVSAQHMPNVACYCFLSC